jgi:L-threonylcarbamoyladenylate synthase
VAFPTETVYGLGADASNARAVRKIFQAKGRPADHPLIVHLCEAQQVAQWVRAIPSTAELLMQNFWPGPLTLILERSPNVLDEVTGGQDTIGLRVPSHPVAQQLLRSFNGGIAAPSANRFGRISPTTAAHVRQELSDAVELVLDGGPCDVGIESTIIDVSTGVARLLRPGGIARDALETVLRASLVPASADSPRASGTLAAHYAPTARMLLVAPEALGQYVRNHKNDRGIAVLARRTPPSDVRVVRWRVAPSDARAYAHGLYATLRELDAQGCELLIVEAPPATPEWEAVLDRLRRAAAGSGGLKSEHDRAADAT